MLKLLVAALFFAFSLVYSVWAATTPLVASKIQLSSVLTQISPQEPYKKVEKVELVEGKGLDLEARVRVTFVDMKNECVTRMYTVRMEASQLGVPLPKVMAGETGSCRSFVSKIPEPKKGHSIPPKLPPSAFPEGISPPQRK